MAKIIHKESQLENEYVKYNRKNKRGFTVFTLLLILSISCMLAFIVIKEYWLLITGGIIFIISIVKALSLLFGDSGEQEMVASGIRGEKFAEMQLSCLPNDYVVFKNVQVSFDNKTSEIDNIVVGKSGVFVIEIKNINGSIVGDYSDKEWIQNKVGRGGTPYSKVFYSPVKQVGTHIYRLSHYFRNNGIQVYIKGVVYFVNPQSDVTLYGEPNNIPVFSRDVNQGQDIIEYIVNGQDNLTDETVNKIVCLLNTE